jgi:DHA1 family bicyclomycin/chloramphenicol resistance-like MFS transporter
MYLPALPAIGQSLHADIGAVQLSLTAFFLSLGAGQLLYGPVSDMVGRKPPLYAGWCCSRWPAWAARWPPTSRR